MYFNYHANIKKKMFNSRFVKLVLVQNYNKIAPCMLVYVDDKCYPIKEHRWNEYFEVALQCGFDVEDERK